MSYSDQLAAELLSPSDVVNDFTVLLKSVSANTFSKTAADEESLSREEREKRRRLYGVLTALGLLAGGGAVAASYLPGKVQEASAPVDTSKMLVPNAAAKRLDFVAGLSTPAAGTIGASLGAGPLVGIKLLQEIGKALVSGRGKTAIDGDSELGKAIRAHVDPTSNNPQAYHRALQQVQQELKTLSDNTGKLDDARYTYLQRVAPKLINAIEARFPSLSTPPASGGGPPTIKPEHKALIVEFAERALNKTPTELNTITSKGKNITEAIQLLGSSGKKGAPAAPWTPTTAKADPTAGLGIKSIGGHTRANPGGSRVRFLSPVSASPTDTATASEDARKALGLSVAKKGWLATFLARSSDPSNVTSVTVGSGGRPALSLSGARQTEVGLNPASIADAKGQIDTSLRAYGNTTSGQTVRSAAGAIGRSIFNKGVGTAALIGGIAGAAAPSAAEMLNPITSDSAGNIVSVDEKILSAPLFGIKGIPTAEQPEETTPTSSAKATDSWGATANVLAGTSALAGAGMLGYALYNYLGDKKKRERKDQERLAALGLDRPEFTEVAQR